MRGIKMKTKKNKQCNVVPEKIRKTTEIRDKSKVKITKQWERE